MPGFRAPLAVVPEALTASESRALAAGHADTARRQLIDAARFADKAGDVLAVHKARAAVLLIDELHEELAAREGRVV